MLFNFAKPAEKEDDRQAYVDGPYVDAGDEPSLCEMLADPMIHLVAKSDKVEIDDLAGTMKMMRAKIRKSPTSRH